MSRELVSIFEFVEANKKEGYGVGLCDATGLCVTPYVDPSDYPTVEVKPGIGDVSRKLFNAPDSLKDFFLQVHAGILEVKPDYLVWSE